MQLMRLGPPGSQRPALRTIDGPVHGLGSVTTAADGAFLSVDGTARAKGAGEGELTGFYPVLRPRDNTGTRAAAGVVMPGRFPYLGADDVVTFETTGLVRQWQAVVADTKGQAT